MLEDAAMQENVESIQEGGPVLPCLIRPLTTGGYEIIVGQRTVRACELASRDNIPASELESLPIVYKNIDFACLTNVFDWFIHCGSLPEKSQSLLFKSYIFQLFDKMLYEYETYSDHILNPVRWVSKSIHLFLLWGNYRFHSALLWKTFTD